ncbi:MAG: hypothetical protein COV66_07210 [Nitrospinae bacterium CG11_big_fil_rev_8_21_14_0_20_45_15]|nr:MAG: hypothetical protein COV66_07210 [Nitrospinae bacterium CG11_big_fil_rev_8_21_14_0_20_45_15]
MKSRFDPIAEFLRINFKFLTQVFSAYAILPLIGIFFFSSLSLAQENATVDKISAQIESLFPLLEGYVVSVEGDKLFLDLKQGQNISKGDHFKLIRYGEDIIHPVSKEKIGRKETDMGEVEVIEVRPDFTIARALTPDTAVQVGDGVRLPFKQITLLVAPPQINSQKKIDAQQLQANLQQSLGERARFKVPTFDLGLWMLENDLDLARLLNPESLARLQKDISVNFILAPEVKTVKGKTVLGYNLYSAVDGASKKNARLLAERLPEASAAENNRVASNKRSNREQRDDGPFELITKQEFKFTLVDLDVGDVTGDGKKELILINENRVMVYRLQEDGKLKGIAQYKPRADNLEFISVDVLDLNGNGKDEIFVTCREGDSRLASFVLEVNDRRFQPIWSDVNRYFRVMRSFGDAPVMMTQTPGYQDPFNGPIETVKFEGGKYQIGPALKIPEKYGVEFILYGFAQGDFSNKKQDDTITLDKDFHLKVYSADGRIVYKSEEYYGQDPRVIALGIHEDATGLVREGETVKYKGRIGLVLHNKERFIVLPKNHMMGGSLFDRLVIVNSNSLVIQSIERDGVERYFETRKQKGYQASYQIVKGQGLGDVVYIGSVEKAGRGTDGISSVVVYSWNK